MYFNFSNLLEENRMPPGDSLPLGDNPIAVNKIG
jgi:hypothetical protein